MQRPRDYAKEYRDFHGTTVQKKRRAGRNAARATAEAAGRVHNGDGKEVDHKNNNPRDNSPGNKRIMSSKANRSRPRRSI